MQLERRALLSGAGAVAVVGLGGCIGSSETEEEFEEIADNIEEHFEAAESDIESAVRNLEREEWGRCGADMEGAVSEIESAESEIRRALRRAESEGYMDEADALDLLLDFVDVMRSAVDELMMFCDEMREENHEQAETHMDNAEDYLYELDSMERNVERAFDELE